MNKLKQTIVNIIIFAAISYSHLSQAQFILGEPDDGHPPEDRVLSGIPYNAKFISYYFPSGQKMAYDQTYSVSISLKNIGDNVWRPGEINLVQDNADINWRATSTSNIMFVGVGETTVFTFLITPKPCFIIFPIFSCYETKFRWQPRRNGVLFGAQTPSINMNISLPNSTVNSNTGGTGMIFTSPPGSPPAITPEVTFPQKFQ